MKSKMYSEIELALASKTGLQSTVVSSRPCSGGCIHKAEILTLADGREFFVKSGKGVRQMYEQEAVGLEALFDSDSIRVPKIVALVSSAGVDQLVLECVVTGKPKSGFFEQFGRDLAKLHKCSSGQGFGWPDDNWIGSTPQENSWRSDWPDFFTENRLRPQLKLAVDNGLSTPQLSKLGTRVIDKVPQLLSGTQEPPALLHGDLWSGNFMCDGEGRTVIFDPAAYFGHREMEFAMTKLFGGFTEAFYQAYEEVWKLPEGWQERVDLYQLYHLLNHLNLFGTSYLEQCLRGLKRYV